MSWFKMDDAFHSSKPVLKIPRRYRLAAVGLWAMAGAWSAQEESDGIIPGYVIEELCGTEGIVSQLVKCGLWEPVIVSTLDPRQILQASSKDRDGIVLGSCSDPGEAGWRFKNWAKYQPTRKELDEKRENDRIRQANYRASQRDKVVTTPLVTLSSQAGHTPPDPTRPDPTPLTIDKSIVSTSGDAANADGPEQATIPDMVIERQAPTEKKTRSKARRAITEDLQASPEAVEYTYRFMKKHNLTLDPGLEFLRFKDHHISKGTLFADHDAAWRTWLANTLKFSPQGQTPAQVATTTAVAPQHAWANR